MSWLRVLTMPGRWASASRIRNSVTVSVTGRPSQCTMWRAGSMTSRPRVTISGGSSLALVGAAPDLGPAQQGADPRDQQALARRGLAI